MAFYNKRGCGFILGFCIIAVLAVSNDAHEGHKRCNNYCREELKARPYDCYIFCFLKCAPSMGGTGCFRSMGQEGRFPDIPRQYLVRGLAPKAASSEPKSDSDSHSGPSPSPISVPIPSED